MRLFGSGAGALLAYERRSLISLACDRMRASYFFCAMIFATCSSVMTDAVVGLGIDDDGAILDVGGSTSGW